MKLPAFVKDDNGTYRPEVVIWAQEDGEVLGSGAMSPQAGDDEVAEHLRATMESPSRGPRRMPSRLTVSDAAMAEVLKKAFPEIEIICGPTPKLDQMLDVLAKRVAHSDEAPTYLHDATPATVRSFFAAAAAFCRAAPWEVLPSNRAALGVHCGALHLQEAVVSVLGQGGSHRGILLFANADYFDDYLDAAIEVNQGATYRVPPHGSLVFERGADLPLELRKEVIRHGWEVSNAHAYPWADFVDADLLNRPATEDELVAFEAILRAITKLVADPDVVRAAFGGGAPLMDTLTVHTARGPVALTLYAPHEAEDPPRVANPLASLAGLADVGDPDQRLPLEDQLIEELLESPEGKRVRDPVLPCQVLMDLAASAHGLTIAHLGPKELEDLVFNVVPRNIVAPASMADPLLRAWRAMYRFLGRQYGLPQADGCLKVLSRNARKRLEAALAEQATQ